jgi:hypothetical protein
MQIVNALRNEALPALERLAQSSSLQERALARFDRDEPPPYVSSTEDDEEDMPYPALDPADSAMPDALNRFLDEPLRDDELDRAAGELANQWRVYSPGARYDMEAPLEKARVERWIWRMANPDTKDFFVQLGPAAKGRAGRERVNIIVRRNIKRRWQKLGVWNPDWGIPGRANPEPEDNTYAWKWPWQHGDAAAEWRPGTEKMSLNARHPVVRALRLRQGLRRGEHSPVPPRSHLEKDASASQAESFIISRPWFMFAVECKEESQRHIRLPDRKTMRLYKGSTVGNIREFWEERGDWKADWKDPRGGQKAKILVGWKWRHESPSPEPEDLSGLNDLATLELTPSEVDALEAVRPPSPPTPQPVYIPPTDSQHPLFGWSPNAPPQATQKAVEQLPPPPPLPAADNPIQQSPPRHRRRRQQPPAQPLRRSARIAAMNAKRQSPPPASKPPARPRGRPRKKKAAR